ncbi:MAG: hypothetical protein QM743_02505 [Chitinophagaceae bacterium]
MTQRIVRISLLLAGLGAFSVSAQKKVNGKTEAPAQTASKRRYAMANAYLGPSDRSGGLISKRAFDSLVTLGLTAKDSSGQPGRVTEFRVYYKERNLYEDSVGNMYVNVDVMTDLSKSNKLNSYMGSSLTDRTKKGDTAIFDDIIVIFPDSSTARAHEMKFILGK